MTHNLESAECFVRLVSMLLMYGVCIFRPMSQLADVNTQSGVGVFHFYDVYDGS